MEAESRSRQYKLRDNLTVWFRCHVCPRAYTNVQKFVEHTSICNYCQMNDGNSEGDASTPETDDKRSSMNDISVSDTSTENSVRSPVPTTSADPDAGPASSYNSDPADPRMTRTMTRPRRQIIKQVTTNCDFEWSSESADQDKCGKMGSRDWKSHDDDNDENDCMHSNNTTSASDNSNDDYGYNISNKTCRLNSSSRSSVKKLRVPNQRRYTVKRKQEIIRCPNSESIPMLPVPERVRAEDRSRNYTHKGSKKNSFLSDQTRCTDSIKSLTTMLILEKDLSRSNTEDMEFCTNWPTNTEFNDGDCDDTESRKNTEILQSNSSSDIPDSAVFEKCTIKNTKNSENLDLKDISSSSCSSTTTSSSEYQAESSSNSDSDSDYTPFPITKIVCDKSLERKFDNTVAATKRRLVKQNLNPKQGHVQVQEPQPLLAPLLLPEPLQAPIPLLKYPERKIMIDEEALANQALYSTNNCSKGDQESLVWYLNHETGYIESIKSANTPLFFTSDPPLNKENDDFWLNWTSDDDESDSHIPKTVGIFKGGSIDLTPLVASRHPGLEPTQTASKQVPAQAKRKMYPKSRQNSMYKYHKIDEDQQIVKNSKMCTVTTNNNNRSDDGSSKKFIKSNVYAYDSSSDSPSTDNVELIEISSGSNCSSSSSISSVTSASTDSDSSGSSIDNTAEDRAGDGYQNGGKKIKKQALQTQKHKRVCPISKLSQHLNARFSRKRALALQIVKHKSSEETLQNSPKTKNQDEDYQKLQKPMNLRENRNDSSQTSLMSLPLSIAARIRQNITQRMISTQTCETKADP